VAVAQSRQALALAQQAADGAEEATATSALAMSTFHRDKCAAPSARGCTRGADSQPLRRREGTQLMVRAVTLRCLAIAHNGGSADAVLLAVAALVAALCNLATALNSTGEHRTALQYYMTVRCSGHACCALHSTPLLP